ncbi:MAG: VTT domain-containing protein [Pseudomonadota bacterium]
MDASTPRISLRGTLPIIAIVIAAVAAYLMFADRLSFSALQENRGALLSFRAEHAVLTAALYAGAYIVIVALSLPGGLVMTLAGGFLFGAVLATGLTVAAATVGATLLFLAAKSGLGDALHDRLKAKARGGGLLQKLEAGMRQNQWSMLFLIRLVPVVPFFVANLAPAFMGVPWQRYVISTFFGIVPGTAVYAWVGAGLGAVFDAGATPDLGIIFSLPVLGPLLALCVLAALPMLLRALRGRSRL